MADTRYGDVLLNLRNTSLDAMKSYYTTSFNGIHEKFRSESLPHFKAYEKSRETFPCLPPGEKPYGKPTCGPIYPSPHVKDARCNPSPFYDNRLSPLRSQDGSKVVNMNNVSKCCPSAGRGQCVTDTHACVSDRGQTQYVDSYCKRNGAPLERHHVEPRNPADAHNHYNHISKNDSENFRSRTNTLYRPHDHMDKRQVEKGQLIHENHRFPDNYRSHDNFRSSSTPCNLPCCYKINNPDTRRQYERKDLSPGSHSPSSSTDSIKNNDYPIPGQPLGQYDSSENSAFSPIRPSHVRRVRSTESGYSSESNGTSNSYKELDVCNKPCCVPSKHVSPTNQRVPHEHRPENRHHENLMTHRRTMMTHGSPHQEQYMGRGETSPLSGEQKRYANERGLDPSVRDHEEKLRGKINLNDSFAERRLSSSAYPDMIRNEKELWKAGIDFTKCIDLNRLPSKLTSPNHEPRNDASRTAMEAFDAHIRKMIANTKDADSFHYLTKFHNSINHPNPAFNGAPPGRRSFSQSHDPNEGRLHLSEEKQSRRSLSTSSEPPPHINKTPSKLEKHSVSHILGEKHVKKGLEESLKEEPASPASDKSHEYIELVSEKKLSDKDEVKKEELLDQKIKEEQGTMEDCDTGKENEDKVKIESGKCEGGDTLPQYGPEEAPSPEVQCPAVDSTLNDDLASPRGIEGLLGLTRVANEQLGQALAKEKKRTKNNNCLHLWQFLRRMLDEEQDKVGRCIEWTNREIGEFRLIKTAVIAELWGQSKNRTCMTYEKMARAMRYYYKMNILEKVPHKRLHFRFGERILSKVLHSNTNTKLYMGKTKHFEEMYRMSERGVNLQYVNGLLKPGDPLPTDYRNGHSFINMQYDRSKAPMPYHPQDIPGLSLPQFYSEHVNAHLRPALPQMAPTQIKNIPNIPPPVQPVPPPPPPIPENGNSGKRDSYRNTNSIPESKIIPTSVDTSSPGSNPSVSPYSGEETPETWSDVDSNDELIVDTDTE